MVFGSNQTFEPRTGTAQLIFGVIYLLITLTALMLAFYTKQTQEDEPWLHYCMAFLFALMALKSFIIHARVKSLLRNGVYYEGKVESCEAVRGITVITGTCDVKDYGLIHIESRLVGETVAHEINRFLQDNKQQCLPALVVGENSKRPRGMFTVKCLHGHLIEDTARLKGQEDAENAQQDQENGKTLTQEILEDELAAIEKTKQEQAEQGAAHIEQAQQNAAAEAEAEAENKAEDKAEEKVEVAKSEPAAEQAPSSPSAQSTDSSKS